MEDNKTKDYIAPITLAAKDLVDIKKQAIIQAATADHDDVGIFEFIESTYAKTYPVDLRKFVERVKVVRQGIFYVIVGSKVDPLLNRLFVKNGKIVMTDSRSCPSPMPGMHVYQYSPVTDDTTLLWALPDMHHWRIIKDNIIDLAADLKDLIDFMYKFEDGTLMALSNKLNGIDPNKKKDLKPITLNETQIERLMEIDALTRVETDTVLKEKDTKTKDDNGRHNESNIS